MTRWEAASPLRVRAEKSPQGLLITPRRLGGVDPAPQGRLPVALGLAEGCFD